MAKDNKTKLVSEKKIEKNSKSEGKCCSEKSCACSCNPKGAGLLIPAGVLLGLGFGFVFRNVPAGLFVGIGAGFLAFAIIKIRN